MTDKTSRWRFVLCWTIASALGWVLAHPLLRLVVEETISIWATALIACFAVGSLVACWVRQRAGRQPRWRSIATNLLASLAVIASLVFMHPATIGGVFQWPVLRQRLIGAVWWMVANLLAVALPSLIHKYVILDDFTIVVSRDFDFAVKFALNFTLIGLVFGFAQWFVLRRKLASACRWIVISAAAWLIGGIATWGGSMAYESLSSYMDENTAVIFAHTVPNLIGGLVCGVVSGVFLTRMLETAHS